LPPPYVIDASIWINVWRTHPPDIYVSVWTRIDTAIGNGTIRSPEDVRQELERGTDELAEFLAQRDGLFAALDEAFVVALARVLGGTVVTAERGRRGPSGRPRIPDACQEFGIPCLNWFDFLREVGWAF
jgi:hypothetical protein